VPNSSEHQTKARLNRAFLNANGGLAGGDNAWVAVVAFYTALHLVERLAARESIHHTGAGAHGKRLRYLDTHAQHDVIYQNYLELKTAAEIARHGTVAQFTRAYPGNTTQTILIDTHLVAIETYVDRVFAPPPANTPPPPPSSP
jgi:hypothetical protein